jgi:16S rRNA G966 N2-methylase RsmD
MIAVTTTLAESDEELIKAGKVSRELNIPLLPRKNAGLNKLVHQQGLEGILVVSRERIIYSYPGGEFFFHPGMAKLRINEILNGKTDQMIKALDPSPGSTILDCTLGLGSDAIVASFINDTGEVTGIECSPILSLIVREGLAGYSRGVSQGLKKAMRRITVKCANYNDYLKNLPDRSVDIVYFDPMFRNPGKKSSAMEAMRPLTDKSPLSRDAIEEALRVARRRVVIKETSSSAEFARLGFDKITGGKYSPVAFGVIEKGGDGHRRP